MLTLFLLIYIQLVNRLVNLQDNRQDNRLDGHPASLLVSPPDNQQNSQLVSQLLNPLATLQVNHQGSRHLCLPDRPRHPQQLLRRHPTPHQPHHSLLHLR